MASVNQHVSLWQVAPSLEKQQLLESVIQLRSEVKSAKTELSSSSAELKGTRQRHDRLRELCICPITQEVQINLSSNVF